MTIKTPPCTVPNRHKIKAFVYSKSKLVTEVTYDSLKPVFVPIDIVTFNFKSSDNAVGKIVEYTLEFTIIANVPEGAMIIINLDPDLILADGICLNDQTS